MRKDERGGRGKTHGSWLKKDFFSLRREKNIIKHDWLCSFYA